SLWRAKLEGAVARARGGRAHEGDAVQGQGSDRGTRDRGTRLDLREGAAQAFRARGAGIDGARVLGASVGSGVRSSGPGITRTHASAVHQHEAGVAGGTDRADGAARVRQQAPATVIALGAAP